MHTVLGDKEEWSSPDTLVASPMACDDSGALDDVAYQRLYHRLKALRHPETLVLIGGRTNLDMDEKEHHSFNVQVAISPDFASVTNLSLID